MKRFEQRALSVSKPKQSNHKNRVEKRKNLVLETFQSFRHKQMQIEKLFAGPRFLVCDFLTVCVNKFNIRGVLIDLQTTEENVVSDESKF